MGQQQKQIQSTSKREGIEDGSPPSGQHSRGVLGSNFVYEEMISPNSLLRSDRFTKSKSTGAAGDQEEEAARIFELQLRSREDKPNNFVSGKCREITSPMTEEENVLHRRDTAITISPESGFSRVRKRGKAPAKVRPTLSPGTTTSKVYSLRQQLGEQNEESYSRPSQATPAAQELAGPSCFSDMSAFETSLSGGSTGITEPCQSAQLSQSPLRPASAPLSSVSDRQFEKSPMRSKHALTGGVTLSGFPRKISEVEHSSSQLDDWSSRCFNLSQQIVEHLRSWNQSFSNGHETSTPSIISRPDSLKCASVDRLSQAILSVHQ